MFISPNGRAEVGPMELPVRLAGFLRLSADLNWAHWHSHTMVCTEVRRCSSQEQQRISSAVNGKGDMESRTMLCSSTAPGTNQDCKEPRRGLCPAAERLPRNRPSPQSSTMLKWRAQRKNELPSSQKQGNGTGSNFPVSLNWPQAYYSRVPSGLISVNFPK